MFKELGTRQLGPEELEALAKANAEIQAKIKEILGEENLTNGQKLRRLLDGLSACLAQMEADVKGDQDEEGARAALINSCVLCGLSNRLTKFLAGQFNENLLQMAQKNYGAL